ncbi:xylanolytic transcriptional activator xlnR [Fusarium denticulatum]|uniref:Xylanolytic transcriptional activator xlnR n=1 Tax=Fusarium denticulatum TaxID=48507 RepID=A0A8H6CX70_9HYPO|nr:xylanolytic transcriptional activator xlnR [Fusarium denticulatum]
MPPAHACDACKRRKVSHPSTRRSHSQSLRSIPIDPGQDDHTLGGTTDFAFQSSVSPQSLLGSARRNSSHGLDFYPDPAHVHSTLQATAGALLSPEPISDAVRKCVDFFIQYQFPNTPVVHEPTLRAAALLITAENVPPFASLISSASDLHQQVSYLRQFTLATALCASVMSVMPDRPPSQRALLAASFLSASRAMLRRYEEHDLEHPNSTSLVIRMWHSAAMQNSTGKVGTSYHYHAEAAYLAQRMRLYNEISVQEHSKLEVPSLRASFWLLYLADKTSAVLQSRPPILNEQFFEREFTLLENGHDDSLLLDPSRKVSESNLESRLLIGFHLKRRIWAAAANLLDDEVSRLSELYLVLTTLADELPSWLRNPDHGSDSDDEQVASYQNKCFWTQRMPFYCFQVQGEPAVERIRRVGTILLHLVDNAENDTIQRVSRSQFDNLLYLLARLDSKASDELAGGL